jgi:M6 family metalloprotease-like protein
MVAFNWLLVLFISGGVVYFGAVAPPVDWQFALPTGQSVAEEPPSIPENLPVFGSGEAGKCGLEPATENPLSSVVLQSDPFWAQSTGSIQFLVLFVDFPDRPASQSVESLIGRFSPSVEEFFAAKSLGNLDFQFEFFSRWLPMPETFNTYSAYTSEESTQLIEDAFRVADLEVDFSRYEGVVIVTDPNQTPVSRGFASLQSNQGGRFDGIRFMRVVVSDADFLESPDRFVIHEVLHTMGLEDLYAYGGGFESASNHLARFSGDFSVMGATRNLEMLGFEKWSLGWIPDNQVLCEESITGEVELVPVSSGAGTQLALFTLSDHRRLVVEYRGAEKESGTGVIAYVVDSSIPGGRGPIRLVTKEEDLPIGSNALLLAGEQVAEAGYTVVVDDLTDERAFVRIIPSE